MTWDDTMEAMVFFRDTSQDFQLYDPNAQNLDEQLRAALVDKTWYFVQYNDADGEAYSDAFGYSIYKSDGTFEEEYSGFIDYGTWYILNGKLYCTLEDGTVADWPINITIEGNISYLYFHDNDSSEYWLYSDQEQHTSGASPIADTTWYAYASVNSDGTKDVYTTNETMIFSSNTTFEYYFEDGSIVSGTWEMKDNELSIHYTDGSTLSWIVELEYLFGVNKLYFTDSIGVDWVYTDISLINGPVILPSDQRVNDAITGIMWDSVHYIYADGSTDTMTETYLIFNSDGSLNETYDGDAYTGTWYYQNGSLHLEYTSTDEIYDHPNSYIEYDPESDTMKLYMGDDEEGYEGGYWLFTTNAP